MWDGKQKPGREGLPQEHPMRGVRTRSRDLLAKDFNQSGRTKYKINKEISVQLPTS
jgi:hypothetical protein